MDAEAKTGRDMDAEAKTEMDAERDTGAEKSDIEMTKEWLWRYQGKLNEIRSLRERIAALGSLATSAAIDPTAPPIDHTRNPDPLGDIIARKIDLEAELATKCGDALSIMNEIDDTIVELPEPEHTILHERYLEGLCWSDIKKRICYSKSHMFRKYNVAISKINKKLNKNKNKSENNETEK